MKSQASTNPIALFFERHRWILPSCLGGMILLSLSLFVYKLSYSHKSKIPVTAQQASLVEEEQQLQARLNNYKEQKKFEFYNMLEQQQKNATELAQPDEIQYHYLVQVGSFDTIAEADALKALLTLNGLEPKLQALQLDNTTCYRVVLGPLPTQQQAGHLQARLTTFDLTGTLIIKQSRTGE